MSLILGSLSLPRFIRTSNAEMQVFSAKSKSLVSGTLNPFSKSFSFFLYILSACNTLHWREIQTKKNQARTVVSSGFGVKQFSNSHFLAILTISISEFQSQFFRIVFKIQYTPREALYFRNRHNAESIIIMYISRKLWVSKLKLPIISVLEFAISIQ